MPQTAAVVGAGVAGLTAAWRLAQAGWQVQVVERAPEVGGLLASHKVQGVACDLGAHRLHPQATQVAAVRDLAAHVALQPRPRHGQIVLGGRAFGYPLAATDLARSLGWRAGLRLAAGFVAAPRWQSRSGADQDVGFAQFVIARAGRAAYEAFYRPYAEKVWGLDPADLSQTCAKQRIAAAAPWQKLRAANTEHQFLLPVGGFSGWISTLHAQAIAAGVSVRTNCVAVPDADAILYTGHLGQLAGEPACDHRGLQLVWLRCHGPVLGPTDTWYCPEPQFAFGRVTHVGRFNPDPAAQGLLCLELPLGQRATCIDWQPLAKSLEAQLQAAGIVTPQHTTHWVARRDLPAVYPVYRKGWQAIWRSAMQRACANGHTWPAGRQGLWLHCNLDHAMATAEAAVQAVVAGQTSLAWPQAAQQFLQLRVRD